jgi:hypothetical protein
MRRREHQMEIFIDDDPVTDVLADTGTIEEAVIRVQKGYCEPGHVVVSLRCDGLEVGPGEMEATLSRSTRQCRRLEIYTGSQAGLVADAMKQAAIALNDAASRHHQVVELLSAGRIPEGIAELARSLDIWKGVHDAIGQSVLMLGIVPDDIMLDGQTLSEIIVEPKE